MADNVLANLKKISDVFVAIDLSIEACDQFWNYLGDSEVTWGSMGTITLIERDYIQELIVQFILTDSEDEDNPIFIENINKFFADYHEEFLVVD